MIREERMLELQKRDFKGIWIPKDLYLNDTLCWNEKILLIEIDSLDKKNGCFASNEYFSKFLGITITRVSQIISKLKKMNLINLERFDGRKRILTSNLPQELNKSLSLNKMKVKGRVTNKFTHNNSLNNTINNSNSKVINTSIFDKIAVRYSPLTSKIIKYYFQYYKKELRKKHPYLTESRILEVSDQIHNNTADYCSDDIICWENVIQEYFLTFAGKNKTDFNICHFATGKTIKILYERLK